MEELRASGAGGSGRVKVTGLNDNGLWIGRSSPSYEPPPPAPKRRKERLMKVSDPSWNSDTTWWNDPEVKRKRRVAKYKLYGAQGKIKRSLKAGYRWFKNRCMRIISRT